MTGRARRDPVDRFAEKIALDETGCLVWLASTNSSGYGTFFAGPDSARATLAHRWSYEHHRGPIPVGLHVDHLCRNRICVRPQHLEPVTIVENLSRSVSISTLNAAKVRCPAGHPYAGANLYTHPVTGDRACRQCRRERARARRQRPTVKV